MATYSIDHPEIQAAIADLRTALDKSVLNIQSVQLFGSTLTTPIDKAKDIDFFISYKDVEFEMLRNKLLNNNLQRNVAVENHEAKYSNCPIWDNKRPLTLHIVLYREGISEFSKKLMSTKQNSIDMTELVLSK